jgi:hypothetical protein
MNQISVLRRLAALIGLIAAAIGAFAAGLMLMNLRADWALAAGALVCVAAPALAGVRLWAMLDEDKSR